MCSNNEEKIHMPDIGRESSLSIDFQANASNAVCKKSFFAPDGFGFYLKVYRLPKTLVAVDQRMQKLHRISSIASHPSNYSCPLSIVSQLSLSFFLPGIKIKKFFVYFSFPQMTLFHLHGD